MTDFSEIFDELEKFCHEVNKKLSSPFDGEPEEQLRTPFEHLMENIGVILNIRVICKGESRKDQIGKPDFAIIVDGMLAGYAELKETGKGADPRRFHGHDKKQWERFKALPNLLYCDGNQWGLYRNGELESELVSFSGDIVNDGKKAVQESDVVLIRALVENFLRWEPEPIENTKELARILAPLCRMLRDEVIDAISNPQSKLNDLARDWRNLLFPTADDFQFADAYAQTLTFALLLARSEGANTLSIDSAVNTLREHHTLLSRALTVLTDIFVEKEISSGLNQLQRIINAILPNAFKDEMEVYFYEDFLAHYDPKLRKDAGVYYTPIEVVRCQVRLIDSLLRNRLSKPIGFGDEGVIVLDPAVGTGTYLLAIIEHTLCVVKEREGTGAVPGRATILAKNLHGFEFMVGPYSVTELRLSQSLRARGADLGGEGVHIYLHNTLESPHQEPPQTAAFLEPIAHDHKKALEIKNRVPVLVCLGNPPYDRTKAGDKTQKGNPDPQLRALTGGWVRYGEEGEKEPPLLESFSLPAKKAGYGGDVANLYNLYVYFWRWALWKVFEHETAAGPGIVSFITASSYLEGTAFVGMREEMRRLCDEIWILDLGGEGRGTHKDENVFAIQTPVAIAVAIRYRKSKPEFPAAVHYYRIVGTREEKLQQLDRLTDFDQIEWKICENGWHDHFKPKMKGDFFSWPKINDIFPWQLSGMKAARTWPIAPTKDILRQRWHELLCSKDRAIALKETRDRKIGEKYKQIFQFDQSNLPIAKLPETAALPVIVRYRYRSFDRQWLLADNRICDYMRPELWKCFGEKQIYIASILYEMIGMGPAFTLSFDIPDINYFCNRGGKDIIPFWLDSDATQANIMPGLLELLTQQYNRKVTPEDFLSYIYGLLAQSAYTERFHKELESKEVRAPLTRSAELFFDLAKIGRRLVWLHTYGERFIPKGKQPGDIPQGKARCLKSPQDYPQSFSYNAERRIIIVGDGEFGSVEPEVWNFEVSGLKVVQSWLGYRKNPSAGKKSSPLDDIYPDRWPPEFTTEFLQLLWVLEATLKEYPEQARLLDAVLAGPLFRESELPTVPEEARKPLPTAKPLFDRDDL